MPSILKWITALLCSKQPAPLDKALAFIAVHNGYTLRMPVNRHKPCFQSNGRGSDIEITVTALPAFSQILAAHREVINKLRQDGVQEVAVPADIQFVNRAACFHETVEEKPRHRKACELDARCSARQWLVTRDIVKTDDLVKAFDKLAHEVDDAMRATERQRAQTVSESYRPVAGPMPS